MNTTNGAANSNHGEVITINELTYDVVTAIPAAAPSLALGWVETLVLRNQRSKHLHTCPRRADGTTADRVSKSHGKDDGSFRA